MAAFSSFHHPFLFDSSLNNFNISNSSSSSSTTAKMCALLDEPNDDANLFSQFYQPHEKTLENLDHSTKPSDHYSTNNGNNNEASSSIITDQKYENIQKINPMGNKRKSLEPSLENSAQPKDKRGKKQKKMKNGEEKNKCKEEEEEAPKGYIHVRARRGQATDSHSLAERVRREKISERMKQLQALVPGCDKVTGKAPMLDEIINYVQSLQNQVEFLSMKLASVNPMFYDFAMDFESFMVNPDENLSILPQEYNLTRANNFPLMENPANSIMFQQDQIPNVFPQENRQVLLEMDEQRQRNINQSGLFNNNMFSFNSSTLQASDCDEMTKKDAKDSYPSKESIVMKVSK